MYIRNHHNKPLKWTKGRGSRILSRLISIITSYDHEVKPDRIGTNVTYVLQTRFGPLEFHPGLNIFPIHSLSIFGSFRGTSEQLKEAHYFTRKFNVLLASNPYSGKWNFHYTWCPAEFEEEEIIKDFRVALKSIMPKEEANEDEDR